MILNLLAEATANPWSSYIMIFVLVGLLVVFFIMSRRSNKKKREETAQMMAKFKKGCHVKTIGGIMGKVVAINDNDGTFILETGSNKQKCLIKFDRQAIYQVSEGKKVVVRNEDEDMFADDDEVVEEVATPVEEVVTTPVEEVEKTEE